jgi:hypothetical protein
MSLTTSSPENLSDREIALQLEQGKSVMLAMIALLLENARRNEGKIPQWAFESLPKVSAQACIELAVVRRSPVTDKAVEIYLNTRPPGDPWEGQLHMPGTTLYMFDAEKGHCSEELWQRLTREIGWAGQLDAMSAPYIATHLTTHAKRERGPCMHNIHVLDVSAGAQVLSGQWFLIDDIPDTIIDHHADMIQKIIESVYDFMAFSPNHSR